VRTFIVLLPFLFIFESLFPGLSPSKLLLLLLFLSLSLLFAFLPLKILSSMRYFLVFASLSFSLLFVLSDSFASYVPASIVLFFSSYALLFYLSKDAQGSTQKELIGLSLICVSLFLNLWHTQNPVSSLTFFLSLVAFLFISGRSRFIPLSGLFVLLSIYSLLKVERLPKVHPLSAFGARMLLLSSLFVLSMALVQFLQCQAQPKRAAFFGSLSICVGVILTVLFGLPSEMLFKDRSFLSFLAPLCGLTMRRKEV